MTLKIERISGKRGTQIRLCGELRSEHLCQLKAEIKRGRPPVVLDLEELDLADVEAVRFLNACEAEGISAHHSPPYIKEWMFRERMRQKARTHKRKKASSFAMVLGSDADRLEKKRMDNEGEKKNKKLVLEGFDTLFNKREYLAAEKVWSPKYIQHSAHIAPGREGLFNLVKNAPATLKYEHGTIVADGDFVIVHGRFSGHGLSPVNWIAADILRIRDGVMAEHWDVIQDVPAQSASGNSMF
jgi:predicted SnoaL-like aldol condensation-catalyzing enzyme